nr:hypothetical protein [Tanacetum cinerariifolium]
MTRSSNKDLIQPFENPERVFRSSRKLSKTRSLDYLSSPEFNFIFDLDDQFGRKEIEAMAETIEEYMCKTRGDYGPGVTRPKIDDKSHFELKGQFLKELRDNTFSDSDDEDANEHIEKVNEKVYEAQVGCELCKKGTSRNRLLDPLNGDYIELNDLNAPFKLRRNQADDLDPTIEEGEIDDGLIAGVYKARCNDEIINGLDEYPSYCDLDKKIHIDCAYNLKFSFMIGIKDMDNYRDDGMGDVIVGKPFCKEVRVKTKLFEGMIIVSNGNDSITYQMVRSHPRARFIDVVICFVMFVVVLLEEMCIIGWVTVDLSVYVLESACRVEVIRILAGMAERDNRSPRQPSQAHIDYGFRMMAVMTAKGVDRTKIARVLAGQLLSLQPWWMHPVCQLLTYLSLMYHYKCVGFTRILPMLLPVDPRPVDSRVF